MAGSEGRSEERSEASPDHRTAWTRIGRVRPPVVCPSLASLVSSVSPSDVEMKASLAEMDGVLLSLLALTRLAGVVSVEVLDDWALPTVVQKGDKVDLRCNYKLEGENMYSLKWYRDDVGIELIIFPQFDVLPQVEFYRYIPTEDPSTTVFVMPGLEVLDRSTPTHIILNNVASHTSGVFKCEVSAGN